MNARVAVDLALPEGVQVRGAVVGSAADAAGAGAKHGAAAAAATPSTAQASSAEVDVVALPVEALAAVLHLAQRAQVATAVGELGFTMANETLSLLAFRQSAFFTVSAGGKPRLVTASGLASVAEDSPYAVWLSRFAATFPTTAGCHILNFADAAPDVAEGWAEWLPDHLLVAPLHSPDGDLLGSMMYAREEPWFAPEQALMEATHRHYAYCLWSLKRARRSIGRRLGGVFRKRWLMLTLVAALCAMAIPVRLSALAPAEVVALNALAVAAPQDGVISQFHVQPNAPVKAGDLLFSLDDTTLKSRREVAAKGLSIARADALVAQQRAFDDLKSKGELAAAFGRVREKEAELALIESSLARVDVRADRTGVAVFTDANDWLGRPVQTGERVLQIADPQDSGVLVWLPAADALNLEPGAPIRLFLHTQPMNPLSAQLLQTSYQAVPSPEGVSAYRLRGQFDAGVAGARIGLRGTARVSGERAMLGYYLFPSADRGGARVDGFVSAAVLPYLRDELRLIPAAANADGSPAWMVHDPVVNRFFRIGWLDFELLLRWGQGTAPDVAATVAAETLLQPDETDVASLIQFLAQHSLLKADSPQAVARLRQRAQQLERGPFEWLLHNYLFFRLPLLRPQRALVALLAMLGWVYTRTTAVVVMGLGVLGVFLAARQWETFTATFVDQLSWQGLLGYTVALACAKALHEMGHALTATRYGVRVAHMGVAFLVMFPMLYTDTGESWKLARARQRLAIAGAGIVTELALAGLATLGWSLAPEGPVKSALFFLATTSWLLTLAVNASPFMRFDGYFILMDWLDFPNLHERSGALARAWLRRTLLGWKEADPERLPGRGNAWLVVFALCTWLYRLTVFLGIALLVYHFFFKLLGVALMALELVWFIGRPVASEMRVWAARRSETATSRRLWGFLLASMLLGALLVPWHGSVHGPAWLHAQRQQVVYSPLAGQLVSLPSAGPVAAGQALFALASPELSLSRERAQSLADARATELVGLAGLPSGEERRAQVQTQQDKFVAEARMYQDEQTRLQLAAPFAGELVDVDPQLAAGVWVQPRQPLATVIDPSGWVVEAFVTEADVARVQPGQAVRVYAGLQGLNVLHGRVTEVDSSRTAALPHRMLDAQSGGPIVTLPPGGADRRGDSSQGAGQAPRDSLYRVKIELAGAPGPARMALGRVVIEADRQAWLPSALDRVAAILVRETGF